MSFELLPNISLIIAISGLLALIGRHIPEASKLAQSEPKPPARKNGAVLYILSLHLPSRVWSRFGFWVSRFWHLLLEVKDIKKPASVGYRIKKMLPKKRIVAAQTFETDTATVRDERYFLHLIKATPKNLDLYNQLGKFYTDAKRFPDARDIYLYLVKRDPGNAPFYARLAFASFKLGLFQEAVSNYEKSLALDSAQPNRYYNLALSLESLEKVDEAIITIKRALEMEPQNKKYIDLSQTLQNRTKM